MNEISFGPYVRYQADGTIARCPWSRPWGFLAARRCSSHGSS